MNRILWPTIVAAVGILFVPAPARASCELVLNTPYGGPYRISCAYDCENTYNSWSAAKGSVIATRAGTSSVLSPVFYAVGEHWSHSSTAFSSSYALQNTAAKPSSSDSPTSMPPIDSVQLAGGWPGGQGQNVAGWWMSVFSNLADSAYYKGSLSGSRSNNTGCPNCVCTYWPWWSLNCVTWQENKAADMADWMWWTEPYSYYSNWHPGFPYNTWFYKMGTVENPVSWIKYDPSGFMYDNWVELGGIYGNYGGQVCSTYLAYSWASRGFTPVMYKYYSYRQGCTAAGGLGARVYEECMGTQLGFWESIGSAIFDPAAKVNACKRAENQIINCFTYGGSYCNNDTSGPWTSTWNLYTCDEANCPGGSCSQPRSISPNTLIWGNDWYGAPTTWHTGSYNTLYMSSPWAANCAY
ncbi:MAG TPA: hypothetical protein VGQ83_24130 [Polyangia bacterium]